jgi:RNA polymerase sigma-70 factor (ECF subfamily)
MIRDMTRDEANMLVREVLAGNRQEYEKLVYAYQHYVRSVVAGYCHNSADIEEVTHDAFVKAYMKLADYDPSRGSFHWWVAGIARNTLLDWFRRRKARQAHILEYMQDIEGQMPSGEYEMEQMESLRAALRACLERLSSDEADLVRWRYEARRTSAQIAESLGKKAGAVRRALQRVRQRLRLCIEQHPGMVGEEICL